MSRVKVYDNDQRNAQVFNLFIYLLLPYMSRAFFKLIFRGRCINSAVVLVSWAWCQRPGQDGGSLELYVKRNVGSLCQFWPRCSHSLRRSSQR
jgi:hypothetical protein